MSPDGKTLASGSKDGAIKLWSTEVLRRGDDAEEHLEDATHARWLGLIDKGRTLATLTTKPSLNFWDAANGRKLGSQDLPIEAGIAVLSPAGQRLAVGLTHDVPEIWNLVTHARERVLSESDSEVGTRILQRSQCGNNSGTRRSTGNPVLIDLLDPSVASV